LVTQSAKSGGVQDRVATMQAYGAQRYRALGLIFQRALLICFAAAAFILVVWSQLERLLLATGGASFNKSQNASGGVCVFVRGKGGGDVGQKGRLKCLQEPRGGCLHVLKHHMRCLHC